MRGIGGTQGNEESDKIDSRTPAISTESGNKQGTEHCLENLHQRTREQAVGVLPERELVLSNMNEIGENNVDIEARPAPGLPKHPGSDKRFEDKDVQNGAKTTDHNALQR